jgi:hypothetical protein
MRQLLRWICALACSLSTLLLTPYPMWAQGFDFGDGGTTTTPAATPVELPPITPPPALAPGEKPTVLTIFYPVDNTSEKILEVLNDTLVEHIENLDVQEVEDGPITRPLTAINGVAMMLQMESLDASTREGCINDPVCIARFSGDFGAHKVVIGRIYTEGRDRPEISLQVFDMTTQAIDNVFSFESNKNLKRQQKELKPALYKLFKLRPPKVKTTQLGSTCNLDTECQDPFKENLVCGGEEGAPRICVIPPKALFTTGQIIGATSAGVIGLGFIGTGVVFGLGATDLETQVKDGIKANTITQVDAKDKLDSANTKATIANVFYGLGALSLVGAVVVLLLPNDEEEQSLRKDDAPSDEEGSTQIYFMPSFGPDGGGLMGGIRF